MGSFDISSDIFIYNLELSQKYNQYLSKIYTSSANHDSVILNLFQDLKGLSVDNSIWLLSE
jgi:hypothetical protein